MSFSFMRNCLHQIDQEYKFSFGKYREIGCVYMKTVKTVRRYIIVELMLRKKKCMTFSKHALIDQTQKMDCVLNADSHRTKLFVQ